MADEKTDQRLVRLSPYDYLRTLPTSDLKALQEAQAHRVAQPGDEFEMIDRILEEREGLEV